MPIFFSRLVAKTPLRSPVSSPVSRSKWNLGTMNSDRPLVPGPTDALDAHGPGQHQVDDVLGQVVLGGGDEALDALDVPGAVGLGNRPGPSGADVGARVRLGQHHGGAPLPLDHDLGDPPIPLVAHGPQHVRELGAGRVELHRRIRADVQLVDGPLHRGGVGWPPSSAGNSSCQAPESISAGRTS